jgi:hypothetical protein
MTDDELLRAAFDELRNADAHEQPAFDKVFSRSTARRTPTRTFLVLGAAAAGFALVAAIARYERITMQQRRFTVPSDVVALAAWRPATDALLPPQSYLLRAQPVLGRSILDFDTLTTGIVR